MTEPKEDISRSSKRQRTGSHTREPDGQPLTYRDGRPPNEPLCRGTQSSQSYQSPLMVSPFPGEVEVSQNSDRDAAETTALSRKPLSSRRTWRVRGVPLGFDKNKLAHELLHHPGLRFPEYAAGNGDSSCNNVIVHTLAPHVRLHEQIATVRFNKLPSQLIALENKGQLVIEFKFASTHPPDGFQQQQRLTKTARVTIDEHFDGITTLYSPSTVEGRQIDVLAISGLGSHPFGSFTHKGDGNMWLCDNLPRDLPAARVMIYGYASELQDSTSFEQLDDLAGALQIAVSQLIVPATRKPLILIGHSLGVLLFGTPNDGMDIESLIPMVNDQPNRPLLESINSINSQVLRAQKRNFSRPLSRMKFDMFCFYETKLSRTAAKDPTTGKYKMNGPWRCLVSTTSATSCLPAGASPYQSIPIPRTHSNLVKFAYHDSEYEKVLQQIQSSMGRNTGKRDCRWNPPQAKPSLNEEQKRILLKSLRFDQIDARFEHIVLAHAKTCKWLLESSEFRDWLDPSKLGEHHGFLWIKAKPGAGKSTLMKFALAQAKKIMKDNVVISFFFNARGDDLEKSTIGMYRSLLLQLLEKCPEYQHALSSLGLVVPSDGPQRWSLESLKDLFQKAVEGLGKSSLVCFIDALDECDEDQIRDMVSFFAHIGELATLAHVGFKVCFSSRYYPHITLPKGLGLDLKQQQGHGQDITYFLDSELRIGRGQLADKIRKSVQEKASGIFLWVFMVVKILNKVYDDGRTHALEKTLQELPRDLHALFHNILTRDNDKQDHLLLCIQWVLFARYPLRPQQLYFAILSGVEPEALSRCNPNDITETAIKRYVISSSKGLAEITRTKHPTVQFIHESVRDFLLKQNGLKEIWPDLERNFQGESHDRLKRCCLNYISMGICYQLNIGPTLPKASSPEASILRQVADEMFPFLEYAVRNILRHADDAEGFDVKQMSFLEEFPLGDWIQLDNLFERHEVRWHSSNARLLYILAEHDMGNLIKAHPCKRSCFKVGIERYGAPIFAALATGSDEALRAFLKAQIENQPSKSLHKVVEQYWENKNKRPHYGRQFKFKPWRGVLFHLLEKGDAAIIAAFLTLSDDVDVNLTDGNDRTPLSRAAEDGHAVVAKLLLDNGADVNARSTLDRTSLLYAASEGHETLVELLLENGASIDAKDMEGKTPLSQAANNGHEAVIQLLLAKGANIDFLKDGIRSTSLLRAASNGNETLVKLLLEKGASTDAMDMDGTTPLCQAAIFGHENVVKLLLEKGASIDAKDMGSRTPLSQAANYGHKAVVRLLLAKGATIDLKDGIGRTPLLRAADNGHEAVVQLLLAKGATIDLRDRIGSTPLLRAAAKGNENLVKLLLERGASIDAIDMEGRTPLCQAALHGHDNVVKLLLENGADVNLIDSRGHTALEHAATNGHEYVAELLREKGASIDLEDKAGATPLQAAPIHLPTFMMLLDHGNMSDNGETSLEETS